MKKLLLLSMLALSILPTQLLSASTLNSEGRGGPQGETIYRWVNVSNSSETVTGKYTQCASNDLSETLHCNISRSRSNSVSGNAGVCLTADCLANAGITVQNTDAYSVSASTTYKPGKNGGGIKYSIKYKKVISKYRRQKRTCTNYGQKCSSWKNTNSYKNVTSKGNYYVDFKYYNN